MKIPCELLGLLLIIIIFWYIIFPLVNKCFNKRKEKKELEE
jgi:flagellar biosynthesis/type III secretory pathway M-ring protein FliF/YscJ